MANVLTVVAKLSAKPGKGDELAAILRQQVAAVLKAEPDCVVYRLHRSKKNPDLFVFYEQYRSDAAFDLHRKAPHISIGRRPTSRPFASAATRSSQARRRSSSTSR